MADTNTTTVQTKALPGTDTNKGGFPENFVNKVFIDIDPKPDDAGDIDILNVNDGKWAWVASGINNNTPSANETTSSDAYYDGAGFTETEVTGKQVQLAISGFRKVGDPAQDYVDGLFLKFGTALKSRVIWIKNNLPVISECTFSNIVPTGGSANAKQTFSFNIDFNGQPRIFDGQLTLSQTATKKIYSATVDTSQKATDDQPILPAIINEETPSTTPKTDDKGTGIHA